MNRTANTIPLADRFPALQRLQAKAPSKQIPVIRQLSATECGAACLAMVLAYYGKHVPLSDVRDVTGVNRDGVHALALVRAACCLSLRRCPTWPRVRFSTGSLRILSSLRACVKLVWRSLIRRTAGGWCR